MAFCMSCGTQFSSRYCPDCGTAIGSNGAQQETAAAAAGAGLAAPAPYFAPLPQQAQVVPQGWAPPVAKPV